MIYNHIGQYFIGRNFFGSNNQNVIDIIVSYYGYIYYTVSNENFQESVSIRRPLLFKSCIII